LAQAADGPAGILHRGPHSLYVAVEGWCVGIVDSAAAQVPCALRTASLAGIAGESARVRGGVLHLDDVAVAVGRITDVHVPKLRSLPRMTLVDEPLQADPWSSVSRLVGAGDGLTPYGDDVLCGWLAIHRAAGVATPAVDAAVRGLLDRTTLLSATLLDCALHGEVLPEFSAWVSAIGTPREPGAAATLEAVGHTSGRGLLAGARRGLAEMAASVAA
jgi:hypothetical protein